MTDIFGKSGLSSKNSALRHETNPHFPSFASALLAHGVNPNDIEGPGVDVPSYIKPTFDKLKENLISGFNYADPNNKYAVNSVEEANRLLKGEKL